MPASAVFDLHCDTLTAFMDPTRCRDTLDDPLSSFALSKIPQGVSWCQCCAIFIPDGLTPKEAGYPHCGEWSSPGWTAGAHRAAGPGRSADDDPHLERRKRAGLRP